MILMCFCVPNWYQSPGFLIKKMMTEEKKIKIAKFDGNDYGLWRV